KTYSLGVSTNRDPVAYNFDRDSLLRNVSAFCNEYNSEVARYQREGRPAGIDAFVKYDGMKWSRNLKRSMKNGQSATFDESNARRALYRPFTSQMLYLGDVVVDEMGRIPDFLPVSQDLPENKLICVTDRGSEKPFLAMACKTAPDLHLSSPGCGTQCFPFYTRAHQGQPTENITDWALEQFRERYSEPAMTKWDIFCY